jgi:CRISPR/Cas system CSM-associated protein Csm3 (group 7 of RAMP superfamily)
MIFLDELSSVEIDTITLNAIVDSALCVGAGGSSGSLADKPIVRNAQGQLLIPASQLKGRLRHECEKLARGLGWEIFFAPSAESLRPRETQVSSQFRTKYQVPGYSGYHCLISQIFGDPILPSRVIVDDLICSLAAVDLAEVLRPGVTINRKRRTSEEKKLYLLETSPVNTQLNFQGEIHLLPGCPQYGKPLIIAALHHIHALGGSKSAGLGWLQWKELPQIFKDDEVWLSLLPQAEL